MLGSHNSDPYSDNPRISLLSLIVIIRSILVRLSLSIRCMTLVERYNIGLPAHVHIYIRVISV